MLFDHVSDRAMEAAQIFGGAAMAAFLGAPIFRSQAQRIRVIVAIIYIGGVTGVAVYFLLF